MKHMRNEKGSALLGVIIIGIVIALLSMVTIGSTRNSIHRVSRRRNIVSVFNIAEAGKEHALMLIRNDSITLASGSGISVFSDYPFETGRYSVAYDANAAIDTLWLSSTGTQAGQSARIDVICVFNPVYDTINPSIEAAVTTLSEITTGGDCNIDGRDWDPDLDSVVDTSGLVGVKTCSSLTQQGSSTIGGNGYAPANPAEIGSYETLASSVGYPTTPEEVLGLPVGALDSYKRTTFPPIPFYNQIVYIDATDMHNHEFNCPDLQGSSGILIVHTDGREGSIKNLNGDFNGLIISDRVNHINSNTDIYGAVVTLSPESGTNAFGNGGANIRYSSKIISQVMDSCVVVIDTTVDVVSWRQVE